MIVSLRKKSHLSAAITLNGIEIKFIYGTTNYSIWDAQKRLEIEKDKIVTITVLIFLQILLLNCITSLSIFYCIRCYEIDSVPFSSVLYGCTEL